MDKSNLRAFLYFLAFFCFLSKGLVASGHDFEGYNRFITLSVNGYDNSTCLNSTTWNESIHNPCETLKYAFSASENNTLYLLESGFYQLVENTTFNGTYNLGVFAINQSNVTIQCVPEVGFSFVQSERITIQGIRFTSCGRLHKSTVGSAFGSLQHIPFIAGVFFASCKDVNVTSSVIAKSHGIGLVLYDVGGHVSITDSTFMKNSPDDSNNCSRHLFYARAGGGIYIEFTYDGALPPFNQSSNQISTYQNNGTYHIENCTFEENAAPEQCFENKIEFPSGRDHMPFGRGGGISMFIKGTTKNNHISVENCMFVANSAVWGSGLFIELQDSVQNNTINIVGCNFSNNWNSTAGGAVRTGIPIWSRKLLENKIIHEHCTFKNNSAILGGGVSHYGPNYHPYDEDDDQREILYKNCTWIDNKATLGSAVGLATSALELPLTNLNPNIKGALIPYKATFEDCKLVGNKIIKTEDGIVIGQGALYSFTVPIVLKGNTLFEANDLTALVMDGVVVKVFNSTRFINNTGLSGGAIGMYGMSVIDLMPYSSLLFKNNSAKEKGGAIFIDSNGPPVVAFNTTELNTHPCFLAYNDTATLQDVENWKTNITFDSNTASLGGGYSVYASSLQGCRKPGQPRVNNVSLQWGFVHYLDVPFDIGKEVATNPIKIEIQRKDWEKTPGETFGARIKLIDEKNHSVQGVVKLDITSNDEALLGIASPILLIENISKDSKVDNLVIKGTCGSVFNLTLRTISGQAISTNQSNLKLFECHPGFHLNRTVRECVCSKDVLGISRCDDDKKRVYMKSGYWGGMVAGHFDAYACPLDYCGDKTNTISEREFLLNNDTLCRPHRNSSLPLCGQCWNNYTVALGSEDCVSTQHCNKGRIWLLLVFFLLMIIFVLLVLKINIDLFTAYLNVWLYSYQIILYLIKENEVFDEFIKFVITLANWKIHFTGFCFIPGLTNFYKLGLNYILPFYVLIVLFVVSKISKYWPRCYINRNVSYALCNLLVLCYTDITSISFNLLHYVRLGNKSVLFFDGNIDFEQDWKTHLPFTILAILLLIFLGVLLPVMLFRTVWFFEKFPFLHRYRLFFDIFQSCFDDTAKQRNYRWFASFYFFCRIWILLIALYVPLGPLKRSLLEASCVLVLATFLYVQPYNTAYSWLNITDAIMLGNLCLVTVFSSALTSDASPMTIHVLKKVVNALAYVPLIYFVGLTVYYGGRYIREQRGRQHHVLLDNPPTDGENRSKSGEEADELTPLNQATNRPL